MRYDYGTCINIYKGKGKMKVTLEKELEPGEYEAIMMVQPYLQDGKQTPTNNAELENDFPDSMDTSAKTRFFTVASINE